MRLLLPAALTLLLTLAACGGGGGSGGSSELSLGSVSPSAINLTLGDATAAPTDATTLSASYSGSTSSTVYVVVEDPDGVFASATPAVGAGRATLTLMTGILPPAGRYTQPLTVHVCKDPACKSEYAGSPQTVRKDIVIQSLGLDKARLDFSAPVGTGAAAQDLTVTPPPGRTFDIAPQYVSFVGATGAQSLLPAETVFEITRSATGLQVRPKAAWAGRYTWPLALNVPGGGYADKTVTVTYDVAGTGVPPLVLLGAALQASGNGGIVAVDALVNMPISEMRYTITGTPDPVGTGWLLYYDSQPYTAGSGPADNAVHLRFNFDRCGYGGAFGCQVGTLTATVRIDVVAFGETWTYTLPATLLP